MIKYLHCIGCRKDVAESSFIGVKFGEHNGLCSECIRRINLYNSTEKSKKRKGVNLK